jgi:uncharacterized protein with ParB-like and HNH nuclease domain
MAELHVSNKTIGKLLSDMQGKKFIIPDFQRPYKWEKEKCETLWIDIVNFFENESPTTDYFLGTIVTAENDEKNPEVIDGQQRLTSFFLLLRAFYKKLEAMPVDENVLGLKMQVGPCLWDVDAVSKKVSDFTKIHIHSDVATDADNETFHNILKTGVTEKDKEDNYSLNYDYFKYACDEYAKNKPTKWYDLCVTILNRCIILPIECNTQETALTIFSTLNDRGLPLADSDIFKAQIYKNYKTESDRKKFTEKWKQLTETCKDAKMEIDDVFRYYTHILRAKTNDKSKEVGLRKFYAQDSYARLKENDCISEIINLANFWWYITMFENPADYPDENEPYEISDSAFRYIDILINYANDYWKYVTSVYYFTNRDKKNFTNDFEIFLKQLIAYLYVKFIEQPTVNAIKDDIYSACISVSKGKGLGLDYEFPEDLVDSRLDLYSSSKISKGLLLLDAYLHPKQNTFIKSNVEIEHIFPKKWQNTNYNGWDEKDAKEYLDKFGNKIVFEKRLNIQAGNGYFGRKQEKYLKSEIAQVMELGNYHKSDWGKTDIEKREAEFRKRVYAFFKEQLNS